MKPDPENGMDTLDHDRFTKTTVMAFIQALRIRLSPLLEHGEIVDGTINSIWLSPKQCGGNHSLMKKNCTIFAAKQQHQKQSTRHFIRKETIGNPFHENSSSVITYYTKYLPTASESRLLNLFLGYITYGKCTTSYLVIPPQYFAVLSITSVTKMAISAMAKIQFRVGKK